MLGEHLDDAALGAEVLVGRQDLRLPLAVGDGEEVAEPVRLGLVGAEHTEGVGVLPDDPGQEVTEHAHRLARARRGMLDVDAVAPEVRQLEVAEQQAAVRMRIHSHAQPPLRCNLRQLGMEMSLFVEQLFRLVAPHPLVKHPQMIGLLEDLRQRNLVSPPRVLHRFAVDKLRPGPSLRRAHNQHRPRRPFRFAAFPRRLLNRGNAVQHRIENHRSLLMHHLRIVAFQRERLIAVAAHQILQLSVGNARQDRRVRNLVAVQMQNRQHRAIGRRIQKLV